MKEHTTIRPAERMLHLHAECVNYVGLRRKNNEDCLCINEYWISPEEMNQNVVCSQDRYANKAVYGVFDGVGGDQLGEMASCAAARFFAENRQQVIQACTGRAAMVELFRRANEAVISVGADSGTTAVVLIVSGGTAYVANAGDSSAYLFRDGQLELISRLHTDNGSAHRGGVRAKSHVITRYLGEKSEAQLYTPTVMEPFPLEHDDLFLLCSDGLTDMITDEEIAAVIEGSQTDRQAASELINRAMDAGGRDNTTVLLVRVRMD